jgi:peroxisomal membrane protein 4
LLIRSVDGPARGQRLEHRPPGYPERSHHALVAGAIGGYIVWGRYSGVNYQIVLYLMSRVLVSLGKYIQQVYLPEVTVSLDQSYRLLAAVVWGLVMFLFEECPNVLHPSLKKSMDEIYRYSIREKSGLATTRTGTAAVEANQPRPQNASCASESKHACEKN